MKGRAMFWWPLKPSLTGGSMDRSATISPPDISSATIESFTVDIESCTRKVPEHSLRQRRGRLQKIEVMHALLLSVSHPLVGPCRVNPHSNLHYTFAFSSEALPRRVSGGRVLSLTSLCLRKRRHPSTSLWKLSGKLVSHCAGYHRFSSFSSSSSFPSCSSSSLSS